METATEFNNKLLEEITIDVDALVEAVNEKGEQPHSVIFMCVR